MADKFFAEHGQFSDGDGGDFEIAEQGVYTCTLVEVKPEDRPSFENPEVLVPQFVWRFETKDAKDSKGNPYRFVKFTGIKYGDDRAGLTILLDSMIERRLTQKEYRDIDMDKMKAVDWKVMVDKVKNKKGNDINKIISVKQANKAKAAPTPPPPPVDDFDDPFAGE